MHVHVLFQVPINITLTLTALGCFIVVIGWRDLVSPATSLSHIQRRPSVQPLANLSSPGDHWRLQIASSWTAAPTRGVGARGSRWWMCPRTEPLLDGGNCHSPAWILQPSYWYSLRCPFYTSLIFFFFQTRIVWKWTSFYSHFLQHIPAE